MRRGATGVGRAVLVALSAVLLSTPVHAQRLVVSAASSLTDAFEAVAEAFEADSGARVELNFAGSSTLAAQIVQGAPVDVFASADVRQMEVVGDAGLLAGSPDVDAVIAAAPVTDTVKRVGAGGRVEQTLDRSELRAVQTPQVFRRSALVRAIAEGDAENATDDASLIEEAGGSVVVIESPSFNIKVTVPEDLAIAEALMADRKRNGRP